MGQGRRRQLRAGCRRCLRGCPRLQLQLWLVPLDALLLGGLVGAVTAAQQALRGRFREGR